MICRGAISRLLTIFNKKNWVKNLTKSSGRISLIRKENLGALRLYLFGKMGKIIVHTKTGHLYITPTGFLVYAGNYYSAAVNWQSDGKYSPVPYFLFCRSIELGLKAFVLAKGEKIEVVKSRKIGHNLILALRKAESYSLQEFVLTTEAEERELQKANNYYCDKGFEYFDFKNLFGKNNLPDIQILKKYSEKLLREIQSFILRSA